VSSRSICNRDDTLPSAKALIFSCSDANIASCTQPLKHDDSLEGSVARVAAIDLEPVCLNGNLELTGARISAREVRLDKLDVRIRVIDPDRGRAAVLTGLFDPQHGLVIFRVCALTFRTAEEELSLPSFDVIEIFGIVFFLYVGVSLLAKTTCLLQRG
jgi:hypothetical protein